jgi:phenylacetate-coenzyme A ligase PaaK-like adenylate-forming protein
MNRTKLENWIERIEALPDLTREGLEALQLRRLNEILLRLKNRGGFYGNYPEKLEKLEDLSELPFTTPEMLASAPGKFLLASQSEVSRIISGATSGTTGKSKRVFYTAGDTEHTVGFFAAGISEMLRPGEKCLIAFPFSGPFGLGDLIAQAVQRLGGVPVKAGFGQSWGELCALVRDTQPETFIGFPVHLLGLARMYGKSFPIRRALVSGDACPKGVMEELEKLLGSKLYPHYGSRECGLGGAVTCQAFHGMHLRENHIIAEIIDESGNVLPDGEYGELVITTIGMEAMPLIRYRTGDYTRILPPCQCGGVTKRLDTVSRRESLVSIEKLDDVLFRVPQLIDYRAIYNADLLLEMRVNGIPLESDIRNSLKALYPHISFRLVIEKAASENCPMYSGKRHIIQTIT